MNYRERDMPIIDAKWHDGYGWVVTLPDGRERICVDRDELRHVVDRDAPGSTIRYSPRAKR